MTLEQCKVDFKYCTVCGTRCRVVETHRYYDSRTGVRSADYVDWGCPNYEDSTHEALWEITRPEQVHDTR